MYVVSFIEHTTPCHFFSPLILLLSSPSPVRRLYSSRARNEKKNPRTEKDKATVEEKKTFLSYDNCKYSRGRSSNALLLFIIFLHLTNWR